MRNIILKAIFTSFASKLASTCVLMIILNTVSHAQCPVTAYASPTTVVCGNTVNLTAVAAGCKPLNNNFNTGTIDDNGNQPWQSSNGATVQNGTGTHSCVGPPAEGAYSLWMGTTIAAPRSITTNGYDMTQCAATSGSICFDMKYGTQGGASPCEGIDLPAEGVSIQYNTGGGWITLQYWDPNGGSDPSLTSWNRYCISLPPAAMTTSTQFRWYQNESSGAGYDAWGLDNMVLNLNTPGYTFDWAHDAQAPAASPTTPAVNPTDNTTYTVTYTNGTETCTSPVTVTVIKPTASATVSPSIVCANSPVQLTAVSSIKMLSPTSCGVNSDAICEPFSTISDVQQVGSGTTTIAYNTGGSSVLGNYGDAYQTAQILFRASELTAAGMVAGKINSLEIDVERIETDGGATSGSIVYPNFRVHIGCTNATTMATLHTGLNQVFSATNYTVNTGWHPIFFNQSYNWDGVSNIVVQICWYFPDGAGAQDAAPNGTGNYYAFPRYDSPGYNCYRYSGTNFSPGSCATNDFVAFLNRRPNVKFGFCKPSNLPLTYSWTSSPAGFTSTIYNPTANPSVNTTYTVSINQTGMPAGCAATASVPVTAYRPTVSISPNPAQICAPATTVDLTASATTNTTISAPQRYTNTTSGAIADGGLANSCLSGGTATTRDITVSGASPATIGANPISSVGFDITCPTDGDYRVRLRSPDGTWIILVNQRGGTGDNFTGTTFTPGATTAISAGSAPFSAGPYIPENPLTTFGVGEAVNGVWRLEVIDYCKPLTGSTVGTLNNWNIQFNAPNAIASYVWSPPTNLTSTTTAATTSNTTVDRTYTVTVTDNNGCTNTANVPVTIGCTLPIELSDFDLSCENDKIDLKWDIASQQNNDFFTVERSFDGINYDEIAKVDGHGNSSLMTSYNFMDKNDTKIATNNYPIYYRLSQTDFDGHKEIIALKTIQNCKTSGNVCVNTYPNPVDNYKVTVSTSGIKNKSFDFLLHDMLGKLVYSKTITPESDEYLLNVDLPESLQKGIYLISSKGANEVQFCEQKIVIQ